MTSWKMRLPAEFSVCKSCTYIVDREVLSAGERQSSCREFFFTVLWIKKIPTHTPLQEDIPVNTTNAFIVLN